MIRPMTAYNIFARKKARLRGHKNNISNNDKRLENRELDVMRKISKKFQNVVTNDAPVAMRFFKYKQMEKKNKVVRDENKTFKNERKIAAKKILDRSE